MKNINKNLLMAIAWTIVSCLCITAFVAMLFSIPKENEPRVQTEITIHNETLEFILSDFSNVLTLDNVNVELEDEEVKLYISGELSDLSVVLNKDLEILSADTITISEKTVAVSILMIVLIIGCLVLTISFLRKYIDEIKNSAKAVV